MDLIEKTRRSFLKRFGVQPGITILSPGRINFIGEHVDYNHGFVLPAAIDKYVCVAMSENGSQVCNVFADDVDDSIVFEISKPAEISDKPWANYFLGVIFQLQQRNFKLRGFNAVYSSTIPIGSGLSSSAAVECGFGVALNEMFSLNIDKKDLALIGQKSEHTFVGVKCGIMDQFANMFGQKGKAILLDCDSLEHKYYDATFEGHSVLLFDSNVKHSLLKSAYNTRREEVEKGLSILRIRFPEIRTFRDCLPEHVEQVKTELGDTIYKRCRFVVEEMARVNLAVKALDSKNVSGFGRLMYKTHEGLSIEYEVSCDETDFLVNHTDEIPEVVGARMMGGGFGGCTINIVRSGSEKMVFGLLREGYLKRFGIELKMYLVTISDGTKRI